CDKAKKKIVQKIKNKTNEIKRNANIENVNKYNSTILGIHNYYKYATHVSLDFKEIAFLVKKNIFNKTNSIRSDTGIIGRAYKKFYGSYKYKTYYIAQIALFPIAGIKTKNPLNFSQEINNYTSEGRQKIHDKIQNINLNVLKYIMGNPVLNESTEYNDNRVSLFVGQNGKCGITGNNLNSGFMEVHHKIPRFKGGTDEYNNLIFITTDIHKLIHATKQDTINEYMNKLGLDDEMLKKINKLRLMVSNCVI
ncbi:MAG: HNH endonuclease signature motif containing protein, partial [Clostridiaceae bacterium]